MYFPGIGQRVNKGLVVEWKALEGALWVTGGRGEGLSGQQAGGSRDSEPSYRGE